jgi:hypothetical protein
MRSVGEPKVCSVRWNETTQPSSSVPAVRISPGHEVVASHGNDFSCDILRDVTKSYVMAVRYAFRTLRSIRRFGKGSDRKFPDNSECFHKKLCYWFSQRFLFLQQYCTSIKITVWWIEWKTPRRYGQYLANHKTKINLRRRARSITSAEEQSGNTSRIGRAAHLPIYCFSLKCLTSRFIWRTGPGDWWKNRSSNFSGKLSQISYSRSREVIFRNFWFIEGCCTDLPSNDVFIFWKDFDSHFSVPRQKWEFTVSVIKKSIARPYNFFHRPWPTPASNIPWVVQANSREDQQISN